MNLGEIVGFSSSCSTKTPSLVIFALMLRSAEQIHRYLLGKMHRGVEDESHERRDRSIYHRTVRPYRVLGRFREDFFEFEIAESTPVMSPSVGRLSR